MITSGVLTLLPVRESVITRRKMLRGGFSVLDRIEEFGPAVESRLRPHFDSVGVAYPPNELAYIAFKDTRKLEVYARTSVDKSWSFVNEYPILKASGSLGPKLRESDYQVPEGIYRVKFLDPNSRRHLSILLNYPNEFDQRMAARDRRTKLGGDIMIHGGATSIGCLAVGDRAVEDLFILAAIVSPDNVKVIISPTTFRDGNRLPPIKNPLWVSDLYTRLREELRQFQSSTHVLEHPSKDHP
jgi:hypothetical protein